MTSQNVLIIGNKEYINFDFSSTVDSFDTIFRFNMCFPGNNNGNKLGNLVLCPHVYDYFGRQHISKKETLQFYGSELTEDFISRWYEFFEKNKKNFSSIIPYNNSFSIAYINHILKSYGCPHRLTKMPSSGYTVIFENLIAGNKVFVLGFTLKENEVRKTIGEIEEVANAKNSGERCNSHSFTEERDILAWLHNNNKIDATLCMVEDKKDLSFENNKYNTKPSDFVINLLDGIKT